MFLKDQKVGYIKNNIGMYMIVNRLYNTRDIYAVNAYGANVQFGGANGTNFVYPTLYLNSNIKITSGDGSSENPYRLSI